MHGAVLADEGDLDGFPVLPGLGAKDIPVGLLETFLREQNFHRLSYDVLRSPACQPHGRPVELRDPQIRVPHNDRSVRVCEELLQEIARLA